MEGIPSNIWRTMTGVCLTSCMGRLKSPWFWAAGRVSKMIASLSDPLALFFFWLPGKRSRVIAWMVARQKQSPRDNNGVKHKFKQMPDMRWWRLNIEDKKEIWWWHGFQYLKLIFGLKTVAHGKQLVWPWLGGLGWGPLCSSQRIPPLVRDKGWRLLNNQVFLKPLHGRPPEHGSIGADQFLGSERPNIWRPWATPIALYRGMGKTYIFIFYTIFTCGLYFCADSS